MNLTAIAAAVAEATGANASNLQVVVTSHEVNTSVFLFYLPSTQMLTYGVQTALRHAIFLNLSTTPGLAYNNQNASQAAYALHYTLGNVTSVTAEAASEAVYAQEPAVARRRRLQQFSTTDSSSTSSSAYSTGAGGALATNAAPPVVQYALQVPVSLSGFGNSSAAAAAASAQLDVLMSSPWLYGILSAALGSTPLDSIGGNTPTMSAVMQVQVTASTPEEAAHWSSVLASTTADNTLTTAVSQSIGANVTLLPRGNEVKLPVDRLANFDSRLKNALEGGVLAGIVIGFLILGLLACVAFAIVFIMRRQRARKLSKPTVKISTPMGADEHEHDYFAEPRRDEPLDDHKAAGGTPPRSPCWWPCAGRGASAGSAKQSPRHAEADDRHAYEADEADEERGERAAAPSHPCCWERPRADEHPHDAEERHRAEKLRRVKEAKPKPELKSDALFDDDDDDDDEDFDLEEAPEPARPQKARRAPPPQVMQRELRNQAEPEEVIVWEASSANAPAPASKPPKEKARRAPPAEEPAPEPEMTVWEASAPQKARALAPAPATAAKAPPPPPAAAKAPAPSAVALPPPPKAVRTREASPAPQPTAVVAARPPSAVSSPVASPLASPEASFEHSWEPVGLHPRVWPPAVGRGSGSGPDDLRSDSGASLHELVSADLERVARERAALKSAEELRMQRRRERKAEAMRRIAAAAAAAPPAQ